MGVLDGRVAIITGAGRGIGREHALRFGREGAAVVLNDRDEDVVARVASEVNAAGGRARASSGDVSSFSYSNDLVEMAVDVFGQLDVLVNNAGILRVDRFENMSEQHWDDVVDVNLKGTFCPSRAAVGYWTRERERLAVTRPAIVNTSSGAGLLGMYGHAAYAAAKAAVAGFTLSLAQELDGIRVNAVAPAARSRLSDHNPMVVETFAAPTSPTEFDRWHPRHVSALVAYLASEHCAITGEVFGVHGGAITRYEGWHLDQVLSTDRDWTMDELIAGVPALIPMPNTDLANEAYVAMRRRGNEGMRKLLTDEREARDRS